MLKSNDVCWCGSGKKFKRCHREAAIALALPTVKPGRVSAVRSVPEHIVRPDYVDNGGRPRKTGFPIVKSPEVIERMRASCAAAAEVLRRVGTHVAVGVTTDELDVIAHESYIDLGGYPSTVGYGADPYPKSVCTSVNEVICHGIPDDRPLESGDIVNVDVSIFIDGVHGDCSATFLVGDVHPAVRHLVDTTRECMELGIRAVAPGRPLYEIGRAIQGHAERYGYGVVEAFVGHGIGELFHMSPSVLHYFDRKANTEMRPGMTFTVEPMITMTGSTGYDLWDDDWTAVTVDCSRTAQFEHTILVTDTGVEILTV